MLLSNHIMLTGLIVDNSVKSFQSAAGIYCCAFRMRTAEKWHMRDGTQRDHFEYHSVILKDYGSRNLADEASSRLKGGDRVIITGKLRNRIKKTGPDSFERYSEVEADTIEFLQALDPEGTRQIVEDIPVQGVRGYCSAELPGIEGTYTQEGGVTLDKGSVTGV